MPQQIEIKILPAALHDEAHIEQQILAQLRWPPQRLAEWAVRRRSVDARGRQPVFRLLVDAYAQGELPQPEAPLLANLKHVSDHSRRVLVVGAGPAGYFAALELLEQGLKPIVLERGKDVRARRRDLRAIQQFGEVNPHSNYCFGEGGAGTYSDGKLYTRSHKRGRIDKALRLFVEHGANSDILVDAHPHIGSNKLPNIVANIRESILSHGGEVRFGAYVTDFLLKDGRIEGAVLESGETLRGEALILATGHSARDIFQLLQRRGIHIEAKPFALGVRIEHPQALIDDIQYGQAEREANLPASSYRLVCQVRQRGVFSFCMCPGGLVVPAATAPGELVVNGMSMSRRDSAYANSGTVVAVELEDLQPYRQHGALSALAFQQAVEQRFFAAGDGSQKAPAARLTDFVKGKVSATLPGSSYIPGLYAAPVHELLPAEVYRRLREAVQQFARSMPGYFTEEANVIGTESRTSSPVRVPRHADTYMHEQVEGLFPCGEGAGYAGGIISAAMDGQNVAKAVGRYLGVALS